MNRKLNIFILTILAVLLTQCGVFRKVAEPGQDAVAKDSSNLVGKEGLREICKANDTISSVLIRKAEALFINSDQRY